MYPLSLKSWLSCSSITIPPLYLVGGTVRDLLLGKQPKDIDLVCKDARTSPSGLVNARTLPLSRWKRSPLKPAIVVLDREHAENFLDIAEMRGANDL